MSDRPPAKGLAEDSYEQRGGMRVGWNRWIAINLSWPLATIRVCRDTLELTSFVGDWEFAREDIRAIIIERGFCFGSGIRIDRGNRASPRFVAFWSPNVNALRTELLSRGYPCSSFE